MKKRILIMAHTTDRNLRKRLHEIGSVLGRQYRVYLFDWHEPVSDTFLYKACAGVKDIFRRTCSREEDGRLIAQYPLLHRPLSMVRRSNAYFLERFLMAEKIDVVINGIHYFLFTPDKKKHNYRHIFDINDIPAEDTQDALGRFTREFMRHEARKADVVTACSNVLVDYARKNFGRKAEFIPNGTYLEEFQNMNPERAQAVKKMYGLSDKFVIGYIGRVGEWIDIDFLLDFFTAVKQRHKTAALLVVGSGPKVESYKRTVKDRDIIFTGGVPPSEISKYFFCIDVAVLPSKKNFFQDAAFHIKLIEYTAAQKMVISTPLEEVVRLGFPNIVLADLDMQVWLDALEKIRSQEWDKGWNELVKDYDWGVVTRKFTELIERPDGAG